MKNNVRKVDFGSTARLAFLLTAIFCFGAGAARAGTIIVTNVNDSGAGSLREAVAIANAFADNDIINFDSSLNRSGVTIALTSGELRISAAGSLIINGFTANRLTISGSNLSRVFYIDPGADLSLNRLAITNGSGAGRFSGLGGGGIFNDNGMLTLTNMVVSSNYTDTNGGGISSEFGRLTITDSFVGNNTANNGGGIYNQQSMLSITNSTVSSNRATRNGGGILTIGDANLANLTVSDNSATGNGGGIYNFTGTLNLSNSTLKTNSSGAQGGGVYNGGATINLINSTVSGNSANQGGGFFNTLNGSGSTLRRGKIYLTNATVVKNTSADHGGGGIFNSRSEVYPGNTIIANNLPSDVDRDFPAAVIVSRGYNLFGSDPTAAGATLTNGDQINPDTRLGALQNNGGVTETHALLAGSPAINAGSNALAVDQNNQPLATDQRGAGFPRIVGGTVDIGAFESQAVPTAQPGPTFTVTETLDYNRGICAVGDCSLREAIAAANAAPGDNTVAFDSNVFGGSNQTVTLFSGNLAITGNLIINGSGANRLIVSGNNQSRVFYIAPGTTVRINNLTVAQGNGTGSGTSGCGGGIQNQRGTLTLVSVTIRNNRAGDGGGVCNEGDRRVGELAEKSGQSESGEQLESGEQSAANVPLVNGTMTIINSTVNGNTATNGGGVANIAGDTSLTNSTISGNAANSNGGGVYSFLGDVNFLNVTVASNTANDGGGIFAFEGTATFYLRNTIVALNTAPNNPNVSGAVGGLTNSITSGDPKLGALANNGGTTETRALLPGSPAINAGNNQAASGLTTDQRGAGFPRISGASVDIGAFEAQLAPTAAAVSISGRVTVGERGLTNATVYLTNSNGETRQARTGAFGYYRFTDVAAGETYVISVVSKKYSFTPQVVNVTEDIVNLNFTASDRSETAGILSGGDIAVVKSRR